MKKNDESFIARFEKVVARHAHRAAVTVGDRVVFTYRQLRDAAWDIAHGLRTLGVGPESVVGIVLPKSADTIAAILGVWRCAAAWVPVDPALPPARVRFLLEDSGAVFAVGDAGLDDLPCASLPDVESVVELSGSAGKGSAGRCQPECNTLSGRAPRGRFPEPASPVDRAYIIHTSGTSGLPKGVEVLHRGLLSMLDQQIEAARLDCTSRSLWLVPPSFDASVSDIGTALLSGACLHIEPSLFAATRLAATADQIVAVLAERRITYVDMPPSMLRRLEPSGCPKSLETILIGGEVCPPAMIREWASNVRLINVYGPTEATVCTSLSVCDQQWDRPLIGQPLSGVLYEIDGGAEGELLIGGPCLARGYVNRPELTRRQFIDVRGARFYRTGDRVRRDPDGSFVFLGRMDRQFKLRGHRIEPEEIERRLTDDATVGHAAVVRRPGTHDGPDILVAFIVLADGGSCGQPIDRQPLDARRADRLRTLLQQTLPAWMIPARFIQLQSMPETPNGKTDFAELSAMELDQIRPAQDSGHRAASLLRDIFSRVLGHSDFLDSDHFLSVGGDSLSAMEVCALAEAEGIHLPASVLISDGSIEAIASVLENSAFRYSRAVMSARELRSDIAALLPEGSRPRSTITVRGGDALLLTGATGFLGCHLLHRILTDGARPVVCLIRARDESAAQARLDEAFRRFRLSVSPQQRQRIRVRTGDIAKPRLGIHARAYRRTVEEINEIVHCAADVNLLAPYPALRPANVAGTAEVALLADAADVRCLHYASTLSVFVGTDRNHGRMLESDSLDETESVFGGYAQSKWAAEVLLRQWKPAGGRVRFYRFGLLTGNPQTGVVAEQDLFTMALRGFVALGCVPDCDQDLRLDITPVSYAASAMSELLSYDGPESTFHIAHPEGLAAMQLFQCLQTLVPALERLDQSAFAERVSSCSRLAPSIAAALLGLSRDRRAGDASPEARVVDLFQATNTVFDMTNFEKVLQGTGPAPPKLDDEFVTRLIQQTITTQQTQLCSGMPS